MENEGAVIVAPDVRGGIPTITYSQEQLDLIKRTYAKDATNDELALFVYASKRLSLDILARQIHFTKRAGKCVFITSIDGYRLNAERTEKYAPGKEPSFSYDKDGKVISATAYVKKLIGGEWHEVAATAFMSEFLPTEKDGSDNTFMWRKMPHNQLAKCAEALALRRAFPKDLGDTVTEDEMAQVREPMGGAPVEPPKPKAGGQATPPPAGEPVISEKQGKRLYAIWKGAGKKDEDVLAYLKQGFGITSTKQIPVSAYDTICEWAAQGDAQEPEL